MLRKNILLPLAICVSFLSCTVSKKTHDKENITPGNRNISKKETATIETDSTVKAYEKVITSQAISQNGLFKIHEINDRFFFEIPLALLGKDMLTVNRIIQGGASWGMYNSSGFGFAGDEIGESVIQFVCGPHNKIFIRVIHQFAISRDSSENGLYQSVQRNNLSPITASFDIKAFSDDKKNVVIDVTKYLNSENEVFSFGRSFNELINSKSALSLDAIEPDKSFIGEIKSYAQNIEIKTVKTYRRKSGLFATFYLNSSLVLLPENIMKLRYYDERVGYFHTRYNDFDINPQGALIKNVVKRWRIEPKEEDIDKYMKGELVEPKKPIIYYIDPSTPKKWVPYLMEGVNEWQKAFEKAGFKNAIYARQAPTKEEDSTWSLEDARFSAIVYKPSEIMNASGPQIYDPRSGEILETHINWHHNVMELLHDWYFVQAAAIDTNARKMQFSDSLMGKLIRFVCSHEVGHTLGLTHNFGSSSTVPVDSLRSKRWVEANGHTPSIMDYARFNYVAQPEDSITEKGIFPRIGVYDEWAIEWGYKWMPEFKSAQDEKQYFNHWVIARLSKDKRLYFGGESYTSDPRNQAEDLGDNAVLASEYGIKNLKRIISHLVEWTAEPNGNYQPLKRMCEAIFKQFRNYLFHVADNIGGAMHEPKTVEQDGPVWSYPSRDKQKAAIQFLNEQLFVTPYWILRKDLFALTQAGGVYNLAYLQKPVLEKLLSHIVLANLLWFQTNECGDKVYTPHELITDLEKCIWSELKNRQPIDLYRRNLQKIYVDQLIALTQAYKGNSFSDFIFQTANFMTDVRSITTGHIRNLIEKIKIALPGYKDDLTVFHLLDVKSKLEEALKPVK